MSIKDDTKEVDKWWKSKNYLKNQLDAMTWAEQVRTELGEFDSYRPLGDCPFFGKLPISTIEKCYKEHKYGTNGYCHFNKRSREHCFIDDGSELC